MKFLIQTINGEIVHDFSFTLLEALRYYKWKGGNDFMYMTLDTYNQDDVQRVPNEPGWIPVGSVEFVLAYLDRTYNKHPKPWNVPKDLLAWEFTDRVIYNGTKQEYPVEIEYCFVKSNDKIKDIVGIYKQSELLPGDYQFSEIINFDSEWRAFVWRNELVGLQNYAGDFTLFPDVKKIKEMIKIFNGPCAYTLDIGIHGRYTSVIEVHDFFSCGLYGFADLQLLPLMMGGWFKEYIR